jgi:CubicO group peptidase (beta-lactamase class C family)
MNRRHLLLSAIAALHRDASGAIQTGAAAEKIEAATRSGEVSAAALYLSQGRTVFERGFGKARSAREVFLLASITKPMTAAALMKLVERGKLSLDDPAKKYIPEFNGDGRERVTIKMLLAHTSGLPDMVPENTELRKKHASLKDFVAATCRVPLLFAPGSQCRYQSMGILLASEIAQRVTNMPFRDFLKKEIYAPLGMSQTSLGLGGRKIADTAQSQVPGDDDWNWNSPYWRDLGAPWGGAHASAADVARFLEFFLHPRDGALKAATARNMISNQNPGLNKQWGIGFMIEPGGFGKKCSPRTFGHHGSTGTVAWADVEKDVICVLLTTKPADQSRAGLLGPVSDIVAEGA